MALPLPIILISVQDSDESSNNTESMFGESYKTQIIPDKAIGISIPSHLKAAEEVRRDTKKRITVVFLGKGPGTEEAIEMIRKSRGNEIEIVLLTLNEGNQQNLKGVDLTFSMPVNINTLRQIAHQAVEKYMEKVLPKSRTADTLKTGNLKRKNGNP